jgi:hypothetical protein
MSQGSTQLIGDMLSFYGMSWLKLDRVSWAAVVCVSGMFGLIAWAGSEEDGRRRHRKRVDRRKRRRGRSVGRHR